MLVGLKNVSKKTQEEEKENVEKFEAIKCDQCDFVADDIPSFISHIRNEH